METTPPSLAILYQQMSDEALIERASAGGLTEAAQTLADAELRARGIALPERPAEEPCDLDDLAYEGDLQIARRMLSPTEAYLLCSCLQAAGVPASVGDTHLLQANDLLSNALGGACIRVPAHRLTEAQAVIAAFDRGDFALDESFDASGNTP